MADSISFTLALIDKMTGPAKTAAAAISTLNDQVRALKVSLDGIGKLSIKVPSLGDSHIKQAKEAIGPMLGPGRKQADASEKYRAQEQAKLDKAADSLERQRSAAQYADFQKHEREKIRLAAEAEKLNVGYHIKQIQRSQAEEKARKHAEESLGINRDDAAKELLSAAGAGGPLGLAAEIKHLSAAFTEVTGLSGKAAIGIAAFGLAAIEGAHLILEFGEKLADWAIEGAKMAVEAVEAKEKTLDMLEAMLGSKDAVDQALGAMNELRQGTSLAGSRIADLTKQLAAAGLAGDELTSSMKAIAQAETVLPDAGGKLQAIIERASQTGKFKLMAKQVVGTGVELDKLYAQIAANTGKGVKEIEGEIKKGTLSAAAGITALNQVVSERFGDVAAKRAKALDVQFMRFHENLMRLFRDVNIEGFADGLSRILGIIDQSNETGKALHDVLTGAFDAVFKVIEKVEPYAEIFFLGMELAALKVANAIRVVAFHLGITLGGDNQDALDSFETAMLSFADAVGRVANGLAVLSEYQFVWDAFSVAASIIEISAEAMWKLFEPLVAFPIALAELGTAALLAIDWLSNFGGEAERAGESVVTGLIGGIENASSKLYDTIVGVAQTALAKFKDVFGIHSPSRVMAQMGGHMTAGLAQGIHAGARVQTGAIIGAGASLGGGAAIGAQLSMLNHVPRQLAMNDNALASRSGDSIRTREPSQRSSSGRGIVFESGAFAPGSFQLSGAGVSELSDKLEETFANIFEKAALMNGSS